MLLGSMRNVHLIEARDTYLLSCRAAGLRPHYLRIRQEILTDFIGYAGDVLVGELRRDLVRRYMADLSGRPGPPLHPLLLKRQYAIIEIWMRWMEAQKLILRRGSDYVKRPRLRRFFPLTSPARTLALISPSETQACKGRHSRTELSQ